MDVLCASVGLYNEQMSARPRTEGFPLPFTTQGAQEVGPPQPASSIFLLENKSLAQNNR